LIFIKYIITNVHVQQAAAKSAQRAQTPAKATLTKRDPDQHQNIISSC